jgi:NAD(P)-dependent dehydrogenase (short-subunit alcohol dehydrogenase family)
MTRTAMLSAVLTDAARQLGIPASEAYRRAAALIPRRLSASPEEIAEVILFLAGVLPTTLGVSPAGWT